MKKQEEQQPYQSPIMYEEKPADTPKLKEEEPQNTDTGLFAKMRQKKADKKAAAEVAEREEQRKRIARQEADAAVERKRQATIASAERSRLEATPAYKREQWYSRHAIRPMVKHSANTTLSVSPEVAIDSGKKQVIIFLDNEADNPILLSFADLINAERIISTATSVNRSTKGSVVGRALVGGALLGPAGALLGAASALGRSAPVTEVSNRATGLTLYTKNIGNATIDIHSQDSGFINNCYGSLMAIIAGNAAPV